MPLKTYQEEVVTLAIVGVVVFLVVSSLLVFILLFYQKKRFQHRQQLVLREKDFSEQLLQSQLEIQEQIFNDISQEIHDNVGQVLSLAKVQINIITESKEMNTAMLNDVKNNIGKAMSDLRDIAKSLSNERIKNVTIDSAVSNEAERITKSGVIGVRVNVDGSEKEMNPQKKLVLFRIVQESMQNIIKHAQATEIIISFNYAPDMLCTVIKDYGRGFEVQEAQQSSNGLGLSNIQSRALIAHGKSVIESSPNAGTTITINMPYE